METFNNPADLLNQFQRNRLSVTCTYIDKLLNDVEEVLNSTASKSPFPRYINDISPAQRRVIEDYIARFRAQLLRVLEGMQIPLPSSRISAVHSLHTNLTFIDIAVEELKPRYMRGYGDVPKKAKEALNGIVAELDGLIRQLNTYLASDMGRDFGKRLKVIEALGAIDAPGLQTIERIIAKYGLVEFRPALATILDRLEDQTFEIAVFGRVSCGKSSFLNRILDTDILPVGVTPITAVPTRIRVGSSPQLAVTFAGFGTQLFEVTQISEFATEQGNPANAKRVAKLVLTLPSAKLKKGITFVDTPGLGSLATAGAAETMAYLPRCDFAIVLIDAGATLSGDDLRLLRTLYDVGIPSSVLLSKSDLINESERNQLVTYIETQIESELSVRVVVVPVSAESRYQHLLDSWYQNHLTPLFNDANQLRLQSVARKIGSTRAALESTLRSLQRRGEHGDSQSLAREEDGLRRFSGRFVQLKKEAHAIVDRIDGSADIILKEAVARVWQFRSDSDFSRKIQDEIDSLTNNFGAVIFKQIQHFLPEMVKQLSRTADVVLSPSKPGEQDFANIAREIPRFEVPPIPSGTIASVRFSMLLGPSFARSVVAKQVKKSIGSLLSDNLSYYRTVLRNWVESVITHLHSTFDSFAELYRGNMRRELSNVDISVSRQELESDLRSLEGLTVSAV